ncbi:MAG: gamma-glutamyl-gamma-aminobutyrate hydrolase family protein [bacterium]|nr:gamma-glutamyl-gamma-aminobutyrate hydrolase family protein [bacterium]
MRPRPLIGITSSHITINGNPYNRMYQRNAAAVAAAGGIPVYIPTDLDEATLRELYERLDAVLLPGGPDVDPNEYGAHRHPTVTDSRIDAKRDAVELTLARWQLEDDRPTFGICRGHQVLNVALGGTLIQDIPDQVKSTLAHDQPDGDPRSKHAHTITIAPSSRLASILGTTETTVNSLHHQSVERPAPGTLVSAHAPDGVVEAIEVPEKRFMISVQWHPEDLYEGDDMMKRLFQAFVDAAADYAAQRHARPEPA